MKRILSFINGKLFSSKVLASLLVPASVVMIACIGLALNAILNPPQPMSGREMMERYLIDGFERSKNYRAQDFQHIQNLNEQAMLRLGGYGRDQEAVNRYPELAYRSGIEQLGPMPLLQEGGGHDLYSALHLAGYIRNPGEIVAIPSPGMGLNINRSSRFGGPEIDLRPGDSTTGPQIDIRPHDGTGPGIDIRPHDGTGPQIDIRPHGETQNGEQNEPPSTVPLPASFWILSAGLALLSCLHRKSAA